MTQIAADDRVRAGQRRPLTRETPTATLTRVQSGVGTLTIEAAVSPALGDVGFGCAYELGTGESSTVQVRGADGDAAPSAHRTGPPGSRRPVLVAGQDRFERIAVDLRQCRSLRRAAFFLHSLSRQPLTWSGSLIVTTLGGTRIELPLDGLPAGAVTVPLSLYQVDGELVLRRETQTVPGTVRDACREYGFEHISWLDDRTPIV